MKIDTETKIDTENRHGKIENRHGTAKNRHGKIDTEKNRHQP